MKFQLGLFDQPYTETDSDGVLLAQEHLDLARQLARQSMVLLKNEEQTLPLAGQKKIAVIGPLADSRRDQLGTWIPDGQEADSRTPLAALRESAAQQQAEILYAPGLKDDLDRSTAGFAAAVTAAEQADVVVLVVGERANISGEARSRAILDLPGAQNALIAAVAAVGKPVVMVVQAGRPLSMGPQIEQVDAVLYSFHGGTMTGPALVDLLWGAESPSGKLPVTMAKTVGQVPLYYNHVNTGRPPRAYDFANDLVVDDEIDTELGYNSNYIDVGPYPLYPFGYGLSYTEFTYGPVELSAKKLRRGEILAVRVPVTNSGPVAADEIVQLYVRDLVGSLARPVRELKGFRRIHLQPGETSIVEFALPIDDLAYYNNDEQRVWNRVRSPCSWEATRWHRPRGGLKWSSSLPWSRHECQNQRQGEHREQGLDRREAGHQLGIATVLAGQNVGTRGGWQRIEEDRNRRFEAVDPEEFQQQERRQRQHDQLHHRSSERDGAR